MLPAFSTGVVTNICVRESPMTEVIIQQPFPRQLVRAIVAAMRRQQQRGRIEALLDNNVGKRRLELAKRIARLRALSTAWRDAIDDDARSRNLALDLSGYEERGAARTMTLLAALSESMARRALVHLYDSWTSDPDFYLEPFDISRVRNLLVIFDSPSNDGFKMTMELALYNAPLLRVLDISVGAHFYYRGDVLNDVRALQRLRKFMLGGLRLPEARLAVLRAVLGNKLLE